MNQSRSWIPYYVAGFLACVIVLLAWVNRDRLSPVVPGTRAPDFSAVDLQGNPHSLDDYRGKVVLVNIWATWCGPCKREMPSMERLYQELHGEGFEILAVSVDALSGERDDRGRLGGDLKIFTESFALTFPILHDPSGEIQSTYRTTGVPESFVLDREGLITKKVVGSTEWDAPENVRMIRRLLAR
jgi:cytochrome c biogenesis protein CcmG/thiol:disulfide interchange protein DsbE